MIPPPQPPQEATDIFSISDQVLADRLQFIEEIGFGNWGSVWLCRPKNESASHRLHDNKIAVKLVHRSKTSTTAARVRSLWNEMKVIRSLKQQHHPSIIPFYSFIITPSYALITMAYHPRLITVEVSESHAKQWFRSLLSGVEFLHKHGVVHNDIKPANILLSSENVPVLVDFGFAERYELQAPEAFHSNLSYGTPEYLSPERARGLPHDTRKSDVWSLGVTFFEILVGRTPFEHSEGEQFSTKADLEKYWARTLRGKWVGQWKMSSVIEKFLRRMILPNADLRCTASDAMADPYWTTEEPSYSHRKSVSVSHSRSTSMTVDKDMPRLLDGLPPWSSRAKQGSEKEKDKAKDKDRARSDKDKNKAAAAHGKENSFMGKREAQVVAARPGHSRSQSQPKLQQALEARGVSQSRRQNAMPAVFSALSPVKHSPPVLSGKENVAVGNGGRTARTARKPLGPRAPSASPPGSSRGYVVDENAHVIATEKECGKDWDQSERRKSQILRDVTTSRQQDENVPAGTRRVEKEKEKERKKDTAKAADTSKDSVRSRMIEWERERERLREMDRLKERVREVEEEREREKELEREREAEWERSRLEEERRVREREAELERERESEGERSRTVSEFEYVLPKISVGPCLIPPVAALVAPLSPLLEEEPSESAMSPLATESGVNILKQSLRMSIGNAVRLYKSSTQRLGRSTPALTIGSDNAEDDSHSLSERPSWDEDGRRDQEDHMNRMTTWIQNVEKVVNEARQNFAASTSPAPVPALPLAPLSRRSSHSRSGRTNRVPRKILAANQIFVNEFEPEAYSNRDSTVFSLDRSAASMSPLPSPSFLNKSAMSTSPLPSPSHLSTMNYADHTLLTIPSEAPSQVVEVSSHLSPQTPGSTESPMRAGSTGPTVVLTAPETPSRKRRATVVTRSPETGRKAVSLEIDLSPSKRREKSRSHGDLLRAITPLNKLEFELERLAQPTPTPRLSSVVDKNLFIASSHALRAEPSSNNSTPQRQKDDLTASPHLVESYPSKTVAAKNAVTLDTPAKRHLEGVYDRFLMSTTGVRRNGKGYQSDNVCPVENIRPHSSMAKRSQKFFPTGRRPMPPPVSSDDLRRSTSVDEFGAFMSTPAPAQDQNHNTIAIVRKAFKAIVTGKQQARTTKPVWH